MSETMPAGRELDALIAEKVMGYVVERSEEGPWYVNHHTDRRYQAANWLPLYSTAIAAAWEIVEHLASSLDDSFSLDRQDGQWTAAFRLAGKGRPPYLDAEGRASGATAPHAICLAALAATQATP